MLHFLGERLWFLKPRGGERSGLSFCGKATVIWTGNCWRQTGRTTRPWYTSATRNLRKLQNLHSRYLEHCNNWLKYPHSTDDSTGGGAYSYTRLQNSWGQCSGRLSIWLKIKITAIKTLPLSTSEEATREGTHFRFMLCLCWAMIWRT